jgi:long-chain acyl-CoA synthetase
MIYGCINYGINLALAKTNELLQGLRDFRPSVCLSPPLLFDSVKKQFEEALRARPAPQRALFHAARFLARAAPSRIRERLLSICYGRLRETFGGRMRMMWTGMAPVRPATLRFFAEAGLPVLEAYGLTECGPIASNSLEENRVGSVGKPLVPGSVRLAEDGEVLVEREAMFTTGYFEADPADQAATYLRPGLVATGDVGVFDEDGFLYLKGRKKEMIITSGGHKIHPEIIEGHLERSPLVLQAVVFGQGLQHLAAVIVMRRPEEDRRAVEAWVAEVQRRIPYDVRIERLHLTAEEFSTANGLLTENLKVNRKAILQRYRDYLTGPQARTSAA